MALNEKAQLLKSLYKPGSPVVFANVYDALTARALISLPFARAVATASHPIANSIGVEDDDLTLEQNLAAIRIIAKAVAPSGLPLSADLQNGYEERLQETIELAIDAGVVGANIEDSLTGGTVMRSLHEQVERLKKARAVATAKGIPDFVINARTDILALGGSFDEAIARGQAYLQAGADCVFVWGGSARGGITRAEVEALVKAFDGRLSVFLSRQPGALTVRELGDIGVSRVSVGPGVMLAAMERFKEAAGAILSGGSLV